MEQNNFDFDELMKRDPVQNEDEFVFTDEEIVFLGNTDLVAFEEKFPGEAEYYLIVLWDWLKTLPKSFISCIFAAITSMPLPIIRHFVRQINQKTAISLIILNDI